MRTTNTKIINSKYTNVFFMYVTQEQNEGHLGSKDIRYADHGRAKEELASQFITFRALLFRQFKLTYVYVTHLHWLNTTALCQSSGNSYFKVPNFDKLFPCGFSSRVSKMLRKVV